MTTVQKPQDIVLKEVTGLDKHVEPSINKEEVDAVLEWLSDRGMLNDKGKALAYAYWYTHIVDKNEKDE